MTGNAEWVVHDYDAARSYAKQLEDWSTDVNSLVQEINSEADNIEEIDGTVGMNEQIANYLRESATIMVDAAKGIETAGMQLASIVDTAESMRDATAAGQMFREV